MNNVFFMVFLENGNTPTYKHITYESALEEARRLTSIHQRKAYVLCTLKSVEIAPKFLESKCSPEGLFDENGVPF